jgi:hypothetical protein
MTFDSLLNVKMPESDIYDLFTEILLQNFHKFQDVFVILELGEADGHTSLVNKICYYKINCEKDTAVRHQYMFHDEYKKAFLISKFNGALYDTSLFGHFTHKMGRVSITGLKDVRVTVGTDDRAKEKWKTWERELGPLAFAEIAAELKKRTS